MMIGTSWKRALAFAGLLALAAGPAWGQAKKKPQLPEPEEVTLETKDGVSIRATYWPGTAKKESIPIIMVHGWEGQRTEYDGLARGLQSFGHTILVPDLRGHGQSTSVRLSNGDTKTIELDGLNKKDLETMVWDIEACKKFLREKNNEGECNIDALCVVGSEFGAIVALKWSAMDWNAPRLPAFKQGQDVKAIVLLSPVQSFKGMTTREALANAAIRSQISLMIVAGSEDNKGFAEAKRLHGSLQGFRPKVSDDPEEQRSKLDLFLVTPETSLTGTKLLGTGLNVPRQIANFIDLRLVRRQSDFPWSERKSPLGN